MVSVRAPSNDPRRRGARPRGASQCLLTGTTARGFSWSKPHEDASTFRLWATGTAEPRVRYIEPVTGKPVSSTTYRDPATGQETKTGDNRKFARKLAALWEADLNSGRDQGRHATKLATIPARYEDEVVPELGGTDGRQNRHRFNAVERPSPRSHGQAGRPGPGGPFAIPSRATQRQAVGKHDCRLPGPLEGGLHGPMTRA